MDYLPFSDISNFFLFYKLYTKIQLFEAIYMCATYPKIYYCSSTWFFYATCDLFPVSSG